MPNDLCDEHQAMTTKRSAQPSSSPRFVRAMHPKRDVRPEPATLRMILSQGWWGQTKIHGHRAQVHISHELALPPIVYTRHGTRHRRPLSELMAKELRRIFGPSEGWTVLDAEWCKEEDRLYVFDVLRHNGTLLEDASYADRYAILPRLYKSPCIETLPILRTAAACVKVLMSSDPKVEGLVFKAASAPGFLDANIVRCRKAGIPRGK